MLLKKIGSLNERVAEANLRKSMSPTRKMMTAAAVAVEKIDSGIQVIISVASIRVRK